MEEVKRRRGRPRKIKLPEEVQNIIDSVKKAEIKEYTVCQQTKANQQLEA